MLRTRGMVVAADIMRYHPVALTNERQASLVGNDVTLCTHHTMAW